MSTQKMMYEIKNQTGLLKKGFIEATGTSVFDMTEDVIDQLSNKYNLSKTIFIDVSNRWTFEGLYHDDITVKIEFYPVDVSADKFGVDEEVN